MSIEHEYTGNIVCPYCGSEDEESWEHYDESGDIECPGCDKTFEYSRNTTVEYCTSKISCGDNKHEFEQRKDYPSHISNQNCEFTGKTTIDTYKPKEEWKFYEIFKCIKCDEEEQREIKEEDFIEKYKSNYDRNLKRFALVGEGVA